MYVAPVMVSAVVPSLLLLWYFHSRDAFPEPARVVWATFGFGVLSVVPVLIVALPIAGVLGAFGGNAFVMGFLQAFFTAAMPEECFKLVVLVWYAGRHSAFDEPMDGLVYGVAASLGFATLENVLYCADGGMGLAVLRALTAVPMHAACGAIMGYYYGRSRFEPKRGRSLALAYLVPMMLHGLYDWPLLTMKQLAASGQRSPGIGVALFGAAIFFLIIAVAWTLLSVRYARKQQAQRGAPAPIALTSRPRHATTGTMIGGIVLLVFGLLAASVGGIFTLGLALMVARGTPVDGGALGLVIAGAILGVLPLAIGGASFGGGIKLLNRRPAPAPAVMARAA